VTRTPAILLSRECAAVRVPSGEGALLPEGIPVYLVQSLGGSFTVQAPTVGGLFRIAAGDADALGLTAPPADAAPKTAAKGPASEDSVWAALKQCYDPEIPVNVVDLGLVYDLTVSPAGGGSPRPGGLQAKGGSHVTVKMTLTAPGCGMGPAIAADARARILAVPGVESADVHLVWDPPWSAEMMTPEGRRILGV
jgi:probable FeS assembly SUF system protein SufT